VPPADLIPTFPASGAPVSVLVDYDGTIARRDVTDHLLEQFAGDPTWRELDNRYVDGLVGSRELLAWDLTVLAADRATLEREAATAPHDETFPAFVATVRRYGAVVEVVSDGLGFYLEPALERLGVGDLPIATNHARFQLDDDPPAEMTFPYGHPRCFVCGTCKRGRVLRHRAADRAVVFIGDGISDRFGAAHADFVFAKAGLARMCEAEGWTFHRWDRFREIAEWLDAAFADGSLPATAEAFPEWRARLAPAPRAFICGPEVWGEGRTTPGSLTRLPLTVIRPGD
jgi:2-hydroxy-3-keto-5-methylthiopentenyl-1-phosphate phosphatase